MKKFCIILMIIGCLYSQVSATNLIYNSSFEIGILPGSHTIINAPDNSSITGWAVTAGSIDYISTTWQASKGSRSIDMSGLLQGTLELFQSGIILNPGKQYIVSFDMSGNPDNGPTIKRRKSKYFQTSKLVMKCD